ncbi:hypothetical protein BY996DRAFT_6482904 [Phakopsora pachyrhizi]|nr:hypothetical protein BY996DRAFT_6482904 [Phakopsora pachyrhizi]
MPGNCLQKKAHMNNNWQTWQGPGTKLQAQKGKLKGHIGWSGDTRWSWLEVAIHKLPQAARVEVANDKNRDTIGLNWKMINNCNHFARWSGGLEIWEFQDALPCLLVHQEQVIIEDQRTESIEEWEHLSNRPTEQNVQKLTWKRQQKESAEESNKYIAEVQIIGEASKRTEEGRRGENGQ